MAKGARRNNNNNNDSNSNSSIYTVLCNFFFSHIKTPCCASTLHTITTPPNTIWLNVNAIVSAQKPHISLPCSLVHSLARSDSVSLSLLDLHFPLHPYTIIFYGKSLYFNPKSMMMHCTQMPICWTVKQVCAHYIVQCKTLTHTYARTKHQHDNVRIQNTMRIITSSLI